HQVRASEPGRGGAVLPAGPLQVGLVRSGAGDGLDLLHPQDDRLGLVVELLPPLDEGVAEAAAVFLGGLVVGFHPLELVLDPHLLGEDVFQRGHSALLSGRYQTSPTLARASSEVMRYRACW